MKTNKTNYMIRKIVFLSLVLLGLTSTALAQESERTQPRLWVGLSGGANLNMYTGTTQTLNNSLMAPAAFHYGFGVGGFGSFLLEFRPNPILGFMLNLGYDNRGGSFDQTMSPCNCPEDLKTNLSYATVQPSIRISPFSNGLHLFFGGAYSYNLQKSFIYTFDQNNDERFNTSLGEFSDMRQNVFSTHVGLGYDIPVSPIHSRTQLALSPFVSYHPYFGQAPRNVESWSLSTVRVGMAIKIGSGKPYQSPHQDIVPERKPVTEPVVVAPVKPVTVVEPAPVVKKTLVKLTINETFPLRNYVFFEEGSTKIPSRYVLLKKSEAKDFKSAQLSTTKPKDNVGRSDRQLKVYHNILNILGERMVAAPASKVTLIGSSAGNGAELGKSYAESVKSYLVDVFGIAPARITTQGRNTPLQPSETPGGTESLPQLREGDRRVDIVSTNPDLLTPLLIVAVQEDPVAPGAEVVVQEAMRYSILFDFDKSVSVSTYSNFLNNVVAPKITDNSRVIIHGHTDTIGSEEYNMNLSQERAEATRKILESAVAKAGKKGVRFEVAAFGQKENDAPFGNKLPEERFYNRTVIIDIVSTKK